MTSRKYWHLSLFLISFFIIFKTHSNSVSTEHNKKIIQSICVKGLSLLPEETILSLIPYTVNEPFDATLTGKIIHTLYALGYFKQIKIYTEPGQDNKLILHVLIEEKTPISEVIFEGNKHLSKEDIFKKTDLEKKPAIEEKEIPKYEKIIQRLYKEKNYHFAHVHGKLKHLDGHATLTFKITEGIYARVQKVRFTGNKTFTDKKLRSMLFTREDWILGFFDKAGTYNSMACEQDRYTLEYFYQSNGFMNIKVGEPIIEFDTKKRDITVTFPIDEGPKYTIKSIKAPGLKDVTNEELESIIPLKTGFLYSRELIRMSIEKLRSFWGKQGYIYADIEPIIEADDENKTVDIIFHSDPGSKVFLNCIHIFGNKKTRDKVIRRQLSLEEGQLLTVDDMEGSKTKIAQLGYFDQQEGISWKLERLDKESADINVFVKEVKTGKFMFQANYGGTPGKLATPGAGMSVELSAMERNLLGLGLEGQITGRIGNGERSFFVNFSDPWFLDRPIRVGFDGFMTHATYDELRKVKSSVQEKRVGATMGVGFLSKTLLNTVFVFDTGLERITHTGKTAPQASVSYSPEANAEYQSILDYRFDGGSFGSFQLSAIHDTRNHHMHISRGHKVQAFARIGVPAFHEPVGFFKLQFDGHWYTPVIGENTLVFHLHGHLGYVQELHNKRIPYRELYNIGGQASVRGWEFGQIGPMWYIEDQVSETGWQGESIGAKKGFFINSELVFPFTEDFSIKGSVFYDGGTGWDTPNSSQIDPLRLRNNNFDYRQSIGFGVRLTQPQPVRIDWGFKLDKREGEPLSQVHFSTYQDF